MDVEGALERASALCDLGRFDVAAEQLRTVLATDPHHEQGLCLMARAQLGQKSYDQALRTSRTAISQNPENDWPYRIASLALTQLGRHPEAQAMARTAVRLAPHDAHCHRILAQALALNGSHLVEARAAADRAVQLNPNDASSHMAVGLVAVEEARYMEATAAYQRALALEPNNALAHNGLARLHLKMSPHGLTEAAVGFANTVRSDPRQELGRRNVDLVLHLFLLRTTGGLFVVACIANFIRSQSDAGLARLAAALLVVLPGFFGGRFVYRLGPQLRGYLVRLLRSPVIALMFVCSTVAASGLIVGAAVKQASSIAFLCAAAFSLLAQLILRVQIKRKFHEIRFSHHPTSGTGSRYTA